MANNPQRRHRLQARTADTTKLEKPCFRGPCPPFVAWWGCFNLRSDPKVRGQWLWTRGPGTGAVGPCRWGILLTNLVQRRALTQLLRAVTGEGLHWKSPIEHREWLTLERLCGGHLVQPPAGSPLLWAQPVHHIDTLTESFECSLAIFCQMFSNCPFKDIWSFCQVSNNSKGNHI